MIEKNLRGVRKEGIDSVSGVVVKPGISEYQIFATSTGAFISASTTYSNEIEYVVNQNKVFRLWILASGANYAGRQTITFTFKMKSEDSGTMLSTTAKTVTVTTPSVLAGAAGFVDLVDADDCFEQYDYFTVSGTITVAPNGKVKGLLLAQSDVSMATTHVEIVNTTPVNVVESAPTIVGNATAAITDASSTVTLTHKSEVRNTGLNTVYLAEGSGTAVAATDFPLYPDESITLKAGTFDAICGAGLTSTLKILKVS